MHTVKIAQGNHCREWIIFLDQICNLKKKVKWHLVLRQKSKMCLKCGLTNQSEQILSCEQTYFSQRFPTCMLAARALNFKLILAFLSPGVVMQNWSWKVLKIEIRRSGCHNWNETTCRGRSSMWFNIPCAMYRIWWSILLWSKGENICKPVTRCCVTLLHPQVCEISQIHMPLLSCENHASLEWHLFMSYEKLLVCNFVTM